MCAIKYRKTALHKSRYSLGSVRLPLKAAMVQYFSLPTNQPYKSAQAAYRPAEQSPNLMEISQQGPMCAYREYLGIYRERDETCTHTDASV